MNATKKFVELAAANPDLPVVAMVDGEIVEDPGMMWMGSITNALVSEIGLVGDRYYDDRDDFKDAYYCRHDEELDRRFNYKPAIHLWGKFLPEEVAEQEKAEAALEAFLDAKADEYMRKAIVIYIREPDSSIFKGAD